MIGIGRDEGKPGECPPARSDRRGTTTLAHGVEKAQSGRRLHAGRHDCRLRRASAAVARPTHADHRRRQHQGDDRRRTSRRCCRSPRSGRGSSAAIRWPATSTGAEHARADLFEGRKVIVTPTEHRTAAAVARIERFWQSAGGRRRADVARRARSRRWRRPAICRIWSRPPLRRRRRKSCSPWRRAVGGIQRELPAAIRSCGGDLRRQSAARLEALDRFETVLDRRFRESPGTRRRRRACCGFSNGRKDETRS